MTLAAQVENVQDGTCVISLDGEVDLFTSQTLRDQLHDAIAADNKKIVIDLSYVTFIDSTMLGILVQGNRRLRPLGGVVGIVCPDPNIAKVFSITALDRLFRMYGSRADALADLVPAA